MTKRLLFLDDIRYPIEAYHYTKQALGDLDLKLEGTHHKGLDDAKKIAKILQKY